MNHCIAQTLRYQHITYASMLYHVRFFFFHILSSFRNFPDAQKVWIVDTYEMVEIRKNKSRSTERKDFFMVVCLSLVGEVCRIVCVRFIIKIVTKYVPDSVITIFYCIIFHWFYYCKYVTSMRVNKFLV